MKQHEERLFDTLVNDLAQLRKIAKYIKSRGVGSFHSFRLEQDWKLIKMRAITMEQKILKGSSTSEVQMINKIIKERKLV